MQGVKLFFSKINRLSRRCANRRYVGCLLFILPHFIAVEGAAAAFEQGADSLVAKVPLVKVIEIGGEYARFTNGYGESNGQFLKLSISRPYAYRWLFETGRAERFGDEGFGFGASYTVYLPDGLSFTLGLSSGTGDYIFPEYRVDAAIGMAFLPADNLLANLGYTRIQSKGENRSDGVGLELTWYASDHWIFGAVGRHDIGQPGETKSTAGGAGITYVIYRKLYLGFGFEYGDISYMLVGPSTTLVDYESTSYKLYWTQYIAPSAGFNLRLDYGHTTFYDVEGISFSLFKEW